MSSRGRGSQRIVIVGGGVAGLSIAARLAQSGLPVTLLERSKLGSAASTRNQGWLHSGGLFAAEQIELARSCYESLQQTLRFCPDCLEPQHEGMAYLMAQPDTLVSDWIAVWEKAGIPFQELERAKLFEQLPGLAASEIQHAFLLPDRAIRPHVLLTQLAATAENAGAEIRPETPVVKVLREGELTSGVLTGSGEQIAARLVILAGGTEGIVLLNELLPSDVGRQIEYTLVPLKTHLIAVRPDVGRLPFCVVDADGLNHIPHAPTSVFGSNRWEPVSSPTDQQVEPSEIERLWGQLTRFVPQLADEQPVVTQWAGTTIQAMHVEQVEPGRAPRPTVIDHARETPKIANLLSVFPGRATLWPHLAEQARDLVLEKLQHTLLQTSLPPWAQPR